MDKYLKILGIQFLVLIFGGAIIEIFFDTPEWMSIVIAGLIFFGVYFTIQIKSAIETPAKEISQDGIAGARLVGIFICSVLLAFILGVYVYQVVNVLMIIIGCILLILERKMIIPFFSQNRWESKFGIVCCGCMLVICGIFSIFACLDIAPCTGLKCFSRIVAIAVWAILALLTLPSNTWLAKFVTSNYERFS